MPIGKLSVDTRRIPVADRGPGTLRPRVARKALRYKDMVIGSIIAQQAPAEQAS